MKLDVEAEEIRDVYAHYGLAMYLAQSVERGLSMVVSLVETTNGATTWDFDARLAECYAMTFGELVTRFSALPPASHLDLASRLRLAVGDRNMLAHQYFWDRAVSFNVTEGRGKMLTELQRMQAEFEAIDHDLAALSKSEMTVRGDTPEDLSARTMTVMNGYLDGTLMPQDPLRVPNKIEVVAVQVWRPRKEPHGTLVFVTGEGHHLVPGEKGLVYGPARMPQDYVVEAVDFADAFPVELNPRPKTAVPWNYGIPLANGYVLRAQTRSDAKPGVFFLWIQRPRQPA